MKLSCLKRTLILMDKSYIKMARNALQYMKDLNRFLNFAFVNSCARAKITCPSQKCNCMSI